MHKLKKITNEKNLVFVFIDRTELEFNALVRPFLCFDLFSATSVFRPFFRNLNLKMQF